MGRRRSVSVDISMKLASKKRMLWIQAAIVWMLIGLAVAAFIRSEIKPLDASELKISAGDLATFSRATEQLLTQYSNGNLTDTFFHSQLSLLRDKVASARKSLESSEAKDDVELEQRKMVESARRLEAAMDAIDAEPHNYAAAINELESLHQAVRSIEDNLTQKAEAK
jgi:hypothetical protein